MEYILEKRSRLRKGSGIRECHKGIIWLKYIICMHKNITMKPITLSNKLLTIQFNKHSCQIIPTSDLSWCHYEWIVSSHSNCVCVLDVLSMWGENGSYWHFSLSREPSCLGLAHKSYAIFVSYASKCRLGFRVPSVLLCLTWFIFVTRWLPLVPSGAAHVRNMKILFRLGIQIISWWGWRVLWFSWWCLLTSLSLCFWRKKGSLWSGFLGQGTYCYWVPVGCLVVSEWGEKSQDYRDKEAAQTRPLTVTGSIILPFLDLCFCMGPDTLGTMEK